MIIQGPLSTLCTGFLLRYNCDFFFLFAFSDPEQDQLKQRDQSLRKQEQEMDSLSFRNQQLARRVELLQEELAVCEAKGKKGKVIQGASTHCVVCYLVVHLTLQN